MGAFTDQMGRVLRLAASPCRIISLVPSQTELLYDLGLREEVVGITKFCVHPASWYRSKTRVGGTKNYHWDRIVALEPDLIIGNKEENDREQIEALMQRYPVWISDIYDLNDAYEMMEQMGGLVNKEEEAKRIIEQIQAGYTRFPGPRQKKVAYLIWNDPIMAAGNQTFIHAMIERCGWTNALAHDSRYPALTLETLQALPVDLLLLSSEPFPFKDKHLAHYRTALPETQVKLVDGEAFSWYGSRLLKTQKYLLGLIQELNGNV